MAMWNRCAICGKSIPVGELCYGVKNWRGDPIGGDTICRDCLVPENAPTPTPPNEWVSVEERLPEVGQEVLVYWRNTSQKAEHFELTHYDGDHWFLLDNTERPWIVVVAWMHLPAPPDRRPPEGER